MIRRLTLALGAAALLLGVTWASALSASAVVSNPYPVAQIGILVSFDHTVSGPYHPDPLTIEGPAVPFTIVTDDAGCTWHTVGPVQPPTPPNGSATAPLDGVVFSFITRTFGFQSGGLYDPAAHTITFKYSGANASVLCPAT